jgi:predicted acetyltransferase
MQLVCPGPEHLPGYTAALQRGWSADNIRGAAAAQEELARIAADPAGFLAWMDDTEGRGPAITMPDGSQRPRLPGLVRWMWDPDAGFAGSINLRWVAGGGPLPPWVLGHIGYAVVPWQQRRGHATRALALVLPMAKAQQQAFVELTTDEDNLPSQRVITANGGVQVGQFVKDAVYGGKPSLRFRIDLRN